MKRFFSVLAAVLVSASIAWALTNNTFLRDDGTFASPAGIPGVGNVSGPGSSTVNDFALWNNTSGTLLKDGTAALATSLLNLFTSSLQGLVPASGGGTTNFLRADGTWAAPPTPGLVYLGTVSVSGGALSDTTILANNNSAYRSFYFIIKSLVPGTSSVSLEWQIHSGGAFQTANYLASVQYATAVSFTNCIPLANSPNAINNADPGFSGDLTVSNLAGTSGKKSWFGKGVHMTTTPGQVNVSYSGWWNGGNGAIDGFQIVASSGTLTSGSVDIYGML